MPKQKTKPQTFSEFFNLQKNQDELEFLDIYANQDIPLFLDPYGISSLSSKWASECEAQIATYFQFLIDCIKNHDRKNTQALLNTLHEVNEISLGYSKNHPEGRGIGPIQAKKLLSAFENSEAAKSGDVKDIADCALLIPDINRDKVSDITANILKRELISFTQRQCKLYNIPLKRVPVYAFDHKELKFRSYYDSLPVINGKPKILLPVTCVRQDPQLSKDKFYRKYVLEFLKAEHSHAGDSLAEVLKNGKIKVRIKDLKKKYPINTTFLYKFSKQHPQILAKYKSELRRTAITNVISPLKTKNKILTAEERINLLSKIKPGKEHADDFHKLIFDTLIKIFDKRLSNPKRETKINDGRKRIDIVFDNNNKGFFRDLNSMYHVQCPKIFIECKNYSDEIGNPEIDQLLGRFSKTRGKFGILICRKIGDKKHLLARRRDALHNSSAYVLVLEDKDILKLITLREEKKEDEIDAFMKGMLDEIIM